MLAQFELHREGIAYISNSLADGYTLFRRTLALPLEHGRVFAYLPEKVDTTTATNFAWAGAGTGSVLEIQQAVGEFISGHLTETVNPYAAFEDYIHTPESKWLATAQYFVNESEVYHFLNSLASGDLPAISKTLKAASRYRFRGILTALDKTSQIRSGQRVTAGVIEMLAANTKHILVGAYDEEGYVIWSRGESR